MYIKHQKDDCPICGNKKDERSKLCRQCHNLKRLNNRKTKICKYCGIEHYNRRKYCSDKCLKLSTYNYIEITCNYCGKKFMRPPSLVKGGLNFCNRTCKSNYQSSEATCKWCGTTKRVRNSYKDRPFCGIKCYSQWLSYNNVGDNHPNWKGGWEPYYGNDWHRQRKKCLKRDSYKCQYCGIHSDHIGSENMDVHHIIAYRESHDNSLDNLITLCDTCHHAVENGNIII